MRFLTFNLWHGLSPKSPIAFEALEPDGRRALRHQLQLEVLSEIGADVCFFQETNPVNARSAELAERLSMDFVFQPDLVGTKLFGMGVPYNLNSGLAILGNRAVGLKWVDAISLSRPGARWVRRWASWQLKEERFALFAETLVPGWGRVLLVNTHLHHGHENTEAFMDQLHELGEKLELSASMMSDLRDRFARGNRRRMHELNALLHRLNRLQRRYEVVLLAGDFNAEPDSEIFGKLREIGFRDVWAEARPKEEGFTFDAQENKANHILQADFPLSVILEDLSFSSKVKEGLLELARAHEQRRRRIDYLWFRAPHLNLQVKSVDLVGQPNQEGLAPSDHFGVCADLDVV